MEYPCVERETYAVVLHMTESESFRFTNLFEVRQAAAMLRSVAGEEIDLVGLAESLVVAWDNP